jgi:hypothetical protein
MSFGVGIAGSDLIRVSGMLIRQLLNNELRNGLNVRSLGGRNVFVTCAQAESEAVM